MTKKKFDMSCLSCLIVTGIAIVAVVLSLVGMTIVMIRNYTS